MVEFDEVDVIMNRSIQCCCCCVISRFFTGSLCDGIITDNLKSKVYSTVVRPVALYGSEC